MQEDLKNWTARERPTNSSMLGRYIDIAPYDAEKHPPELWQAFGGLAANDLVFHFGWPQMNSANDLKALLQEPNESGDYITCIFTNKDTGKAMGMASYMSIVPEDGRIETGCVAHGSELQKTRAATEAHYLMARRVFDELGYRRYEWKLNNPNQPSHNAAKRLGFTFEGVFRQHQVKPYGNRDTAWYSMLNHEWPKCRKAFEAWLDPSNFDRHKRQHQTLVSIRQNYEQTS